jgi:transketolase
MIIISDTDVLKLKGYSGIYKITDEDGKYMELEAQTECHNIVLYENKNDEDQIKVVQFTNTQARREYENTNKNFKSGELVAYRDYSENILDYIWAVILFINGNNADIKYYNNTKVEICQKRVSINAHLQKYIRNKFIDNDVTYDRYEKINPNKLSFPADKILDVYIS